MGKEQAGFVLAAVAGLWIVYLVPQLLRHRRQLADARVDDRFSERLRVLRVAESPASAGAHVPSQGRVQLHPRGGDRAMHRPQSVADRVSADGAYLTASERAARAAALARRAAAARRRARLVAGLLLVTLITWGAVLTAQLAVLVAVAPPLLLGAVLIAGRRAVLAGQRADAAWAAGAARRAARPGGSSRTLAVGRAVHPSEAVTEILEKVPAGPVRSAAERVLATGEVPVVAGTEARESRPAATEPAPTPSPAPSEDAAWVPVPVPPPTYVLKPEARRPEPRPLTGPQPAVPAASGAGADEAPEVRPTTGGVALDAILARRRASGE
ncbi:hypothetical protein Q6346_09350 [Isoptericola sp. b490]|uniref:hypothetical protein n=1 Tax=Actinotalea lenta TaxID=3064654 RepID=UPI0027133494|nr:hypothetical protein [Isoptericola sp. b490]MDO8121514.1 hypothetical protein [Isoptericola sp. b490]